jgi:hypothetical protein
MHLVRGQAECDIGHAFPAEDAAVGVDLIGSRALWQAVTALRDRAAMSRWRAENPHLMVRDGRSTAMLRRSAEEDDELAEVLLDHARRVDHALGRRSI